MRFPRLGALGLAAVLAGCSSDLLGPDFETDFATLAGCGDVFFYAVDAADEGRPSREGISVSTRWFSGTPTGTPSPSSGWSGRTPA